MCKTGTLRGLEEQRRKDRDMIGLTMSLSRMSLSIHQLTGAFRDLTNKKIRKMISQREAKVHGVMEIRTMLVLPQNNLKTREFKVAAIHFKIQEPLVQGQVKVELSQRQMQEAKDLKLDLNMHPREERMNQTFKLKITDS